MTSFLHKEGRRSMTIYQLECFIAVAEELNFSAAAERLFTTQPAITYQINALEKETGLHLFERTTRRTKLTAAGQSFYLDMVQMTSFGRQALKKAQDIQAADRSHLVVGLRQLFDYGTFASILAEYHQHYPHELQRQQSLVHHQQLTGAACEQPQADQQTSKCRFSV
jgi:DNA-binding transcriptional LysR family regulator